MSKTLFISAIAAAVLSGCAGGANYVDPMQRLRNSSMAVVDAYAESVTSYLTKRSVADALAAAKEAAANNLKDPGSAQFRNVRVVMYGNSKIVCGEINGKNSYGGYVGFVPFVASTTAATLYDRDSRYAEVTTAANVGITTACLSNRPDAPITALR